MDQISAHLDRGWSLIEQKSFRKAAFSARQVLDLDPESPDAYTLIGLAALGEHDTEDALEAFDRARELDPDFLAPIVYSAEALGTDPERVSEAIERLEEAYELVDPGSPEWVDAVLLHVDLLLTADDHEGAARKLGLVRPEMLTLTDQQMQAGKLAVQLDDLDLAEMALAPVVKRGAPPPDALYSLAQIAERRGDGAKAIGLSLQVRKAELALADSADLPDPRLLGEVCQAVIYALEQRFLDVVDEAKVLVREAPPEELVADGVDPWIPLLLTGPPPDPRRQSDWTSRVTHVFVYRLNMRFDSPHRDLWESRLREYLTEAIERFVDLGG
jgi:tetratricopeptide (TPR) repeat protein